MTHTALTRYINADILFGVNIPPLFGALDFTLFGIRAIAADVPICGVGDVAPCETSANMGSFSGAEI